MTPLGFSKHIDDLTGRLHLQHLRGPSRQQQSLGWVGQAMPEAEGPTSLDDGGHQAAPSKLSSHWRPLSAPELPLFHGNLKYVFQRESSLFSSVGGSLNRSLMGPNAAHRCPLATTYFGVCVRGGGRAGRTLKSGSGLQASPDTLPCTSFPSKIPPSLSEGTKLAVRG